MHALGEREKRKRHMNKPKKVEYKVNAYGAMPFYQLNNIVSTMYVDGATSVCQLHKAYFAHGNKYIK
jgi:hypothetical protein